jgi:hypothetical protein
VRRLLAVVAAVVGALAPVTAASASPHAAGTVPRATADGQLGIRLLDAPTARRDDPRARIYIVDHVKQGESFTRHIEVSNTTSGPLAVKVYAGAATVGAGTFQFGAGRATNDLTSWTTVSPTSIDVAAHGVREITVTIAVPNGATDGERYGVIWAATGSTGGGNVQSVNRVGIRVYLSVGEGKEPPSDFTVDTLQAERGSDRKAVVLAKVHNTGQRALDMRGTLNLKNGPGGLSAGPYPATLGTTLGPGETETVRVVLPAAVEGGPWTAVLALSSGQLTHTVQGKLTFPAAGTVAAPVVPKSVDKTTSSSPVVLIAGGLIGLVFVGLLLWLILWRRRKDTDEPVA